MKKTLAYRAYYRLKHAETFAFAFLIGLMLGRIVPWTFFILPVLLICSIGMAASLLSRQYRNKTPFSRKRNAA